jgi:hypothetical protein
MPARVALCPASVRCRIRWGPHLKQLLGDFHWLIPVNSSCQLLKSVMSSVCAFAEIVISVAAGGGRGGGPLTMANDVFKILKDLELKAVGLDEQTKMQEGYFIAFRSVGLPIHKDDFNNPWSPLGLNLQKDLPPGQSSTTGTDPKDVPKTAAAEMDEAKIFAANIAHSQQSYLNAFLLCDDKLRMNNEYSVMPGSSKLSDAWYAIITGANGIPTQSELNPQMKQALEAARAKLMDEDDNPTRHYEAYMRFEDEYKQKVKQWTRAFAAAFTDPMKLQNWPLEGRAYHEDADEAMDRWTGLGHKQEIETAIATLAAQPPNDANA